jgi:single-strand DNA-binding protein
MTTNHVTITGNLTRDPQLRFTPTGQANATFGVAVNRRWQNRQTSEWEEATSFFDIVAWGSLAENAAQSLTKGTRVVIDGRLDQRSWETDEGDRRSKVEITADEIAASLRWATATVTKTDRSAPAHVGAVNADGDNHNSDETF